MTNIYLLSKFNNYFNRKLIKYENFGDYPSDGLSFGPVNFNPSDGVTTTLVIGGPTQQIDDCDFDYMLELDEYNNIVRRWFILEHERTRAKQWKITLRRDVIADYYNDIKNSVAFISKAKISDFNNPLLFNNENVTFNQIKTKELLLNEGINASEEPYIVGYISSGLTEEKTISVNIPEEGIETLESLDSIVSFNDPTDLLRGAKATSILSLRILFDVKFVAPLTGITRWQSWRFYSENLGKTWSYEEGNEDLTKPAVAEYKYYFNLNANNPFGKYFNTNTYLDWLLAKGYENNDISAVRAINGKIYSYGGKKYKAIVSTGSGSSFSDYPVNEDEYGVALRSSITSSIVSISQELGAEVSVVPVSKNEKSFRCVTTFQACSISFQEVGTADYSVTIKQGRRHLEDAPYDMFAMPYNEYNFALAMEISRQLGADCYDIQILPYFPCRDAVSDSHDYAYIEDSTIEVPIYRGETQIDSLYWCKSSSFEITLIAGENDFPLSQDVSFLDFPSTPDEIKVRNDTEICRITSPNFNGSYEFSIMKNFGVRGFNVTCTYKPITPYINVRPIYSGLYGDDYNDSRGLICNGDFSIARVQDSWTQYEQNNKNYLNVFDTQIKTMDKNNALSVTSQIVQSQLSAATTGLTVGMMTSNVYAGIGAAAASGTAGLIDVAIGQSAYQNNRQMQHDMFYLNLQTIRARPDTLTKIAAQSANNKKFPFVEYYTCTEKEKELFRKKLEFEGYSIGVVDDVLNWINSPYLKATLIRSPIQDDYHIVSEINNELSKGVYLWGYNQE